MKVGMKVIEKKRNGWKDEMILCRSEGWMEGGREGEEG